MGWSDGVVSLRLVMAFQMGVSGPMGVPGQWNPNQDLAWHLATTKVFDHPSIEKS